MNNYRLRQLPIWAACVGLLMGCGKGTILDGNTNGIPQIGVSADTLDFGISGLWRSLVIYNTGGGTLSWTLTDWPAWVEPSNSTGSLSRDEFQSVLLELDRSGLDPGSNASAMPLNSNGGDLQIVVLAELEEGAVLGQMPDTLDFGTTLDSIPLTIMNAGGGTLVWSTSISDSLFSVVPNVGVTVSQSVAWIYFNRDSVSLGDHQALLLINSNGGSEQVLLRGAGSNVEGLWLSYSTGADGYYATQPTDYYFVVRFDRPQDWQDFKITRIRARLYTLSGAYDEVQLSCWPVVESQGYLFPDIYDLLYQSPIYDPISGLNEWTVNWPLSLSIFCVGYLQKDADFPIYPNPYFDDASPAARSYLVYTDYSGYPVVDLLAQWDWCIEVFVEPLPAVAGFLPQEGVWLMPSKIFMPNLMAGERPEAAARRVIQPLPDW